jgi:hypothetical protein
MKMIMRAKIDAGAIAMGIVGVILAGAVAGIGASNTKQPSAPSAAPRLKQEHPAGCYLIWGERDLFKTCDFLKGGQIMVQWRDIAPARGKFDWSKLDEGLRFFAKIGRPTTVQVNANEKPDWLWNYVANCGNNRGVIPQYWDPRYILCCELREQSWCDSSILGSPLHSDSERMDRGSCRSPQGLSAQASDPLRSGESQRNRDGTYVGAPCGPESERHMDLSPGRAPLPDALDAGGDFKEVLLHDHESLHGRPHAGD